MYLFNELKIIIQGNFEQVNIFLKFYLLLKLITICIEAVTSINQHIFKIEQYLLYFFFFFNFQYF